MTALPSDRERGLTPRRTVGLLALLIPAVFLSLRPIDDVDVFWQVRLGEHVLERGFDSAEPLSYRRPDEPLSWLGWLGQVGLAVVHRVAGWEGVQAGHVLLYGAALGLVWVRISRTRAALGTGLVAALLVFLPCMTNCGERPQTFAFFAFSLLLLAGESMGRAWKYWVVVVPLVLIWQNVHPSLPVAVGVLGARAVGAWLDERHCATERALAWRRPLLTSAAAGVAVFCTPTGFRVLELGARNAELSRWLGIGEWQPAWAMLPATAGFWFVLGLAVLLWIRRRLRLPWEELLPLLLLTIAAVYWTRMIVFWALLLGPTLARLLDRTVGEVFPAVRSPALFRRPAPCWRYAAVGLVVATLAVASPWVRPRVAWLPESRRCLFDPQIPLAGIDALGRAVGDGRIYNYREWGGILAFTGSPGWRVAIDGRVYRYAPDVWRSYTNVALGRDEYREVFSRERPDALFLRPSHDHRLIDRLRTDPGWQDYYSDPTCHIFLSRKSLFAEAK